MHPEPYVLPEGSAGIITRAGGAGRRAWSGGTTVVRALETAVDPRGGVRPGAGETSLFTHPPYPFEVVDRLLTNFHLPRSTLLMLVCAFGGYENVMPAYREAVEQGYRFYSYGDAMAVV